MKILHYNIILVACLLLTGCYQYNLESLWAVPELKTVPADNESGYIELRGWSSSQGGADFYFEVSRSSDFNKENTSEYSASYSYQDSITNYISSWSGLSEPGIYYYRFCARRGPDTVYASNVESFTAENPLEIQPAVNITSNGVTLTCFTYGGYYREKHFLVSTKRDFQDAITVDVNSSSSIIDGHYTFTGEIDVLQPATTYYAKFVMENTDENITLESDIIEFTTEEKGMIEVSLNMKFSDNGKYPKFKILIRDPETKTWYGPYIASSPYEDGGYEFENKVEVPRIDGGYSIYAVNDNDTNWDSSGYVVLGNGMYTSGKAQNKIYYAENDFGGAENRVVNISPYEKTGQLSVTYPGTWGDVQAVRLEEIYDKGFFTGNSFFLVGWEPLEYAKDYTGWSADGCIKDGSTNVYSFNMFPVSIPSEYVNIILEFTDGTTKELPCPEFRIEAGKTTVISLE